MEGNHEAVRPLGTSDDSKREAMQTGQWQFRRDIDAVGFPIDLQQTLAPPSFFDWHASVDAGDPSVAKRPALPVTYTHPQERTKKRKTAHRHVRSPSLLFSAPILSPPVANATSERLFASSTFQIGKETRMAPPESKWTGDATAWLEAEMSIARLSLTDDPLARTASGRSRSNSAPPAMMLVPTAHELTHSPPDMSTEALKAQLLSILRMRSDSGGRLSDAALKLRKWALFNAWKRSNSLPPIRIADVSSLTALVEVASSPSALSAVDMVRSPSLVPEPQASESAPDSAAADSIMHEGVVAEPVTVHEPNEPTGISKASLVTTEALLAAAGQPRRPPLRKARSAPAKASQAAKTSPKGRASAPKEPFSSSETVTVHVECVA